MGTQTLKSFTPEVCEKLKFYVYRLIDPRTGETFYVGKGNGNRVFAHANLARNYKPEPDFKDAVNSTQQQIRAIQNAGLEVLHIIHRHGMDEQTALHVEAALIDAYPGATNRVQGHGAAAVGARNTYQIIEHYQAPIAVFKHRCILISVNREPTYEAVRHAWKISRTSAEKAEYVLAVVAGMIRGVYIAEHWLPATPENFPNLPAMPGRMGFVGREAPPDIASIYEKHRVPPEFRKAGASNPIKYTFKG